MTTFDYWFLLIIGLILMLANIYNARNAGKPRKDKDKNYPSGSWYTLDVVIGLFIILIALGVI